MATHCRAKPTIPPHFTKVVRGSAVSKVLIFLGREEADVTNAVVILIADFQGLAGWRIASSAMRSTSSWQPLKDSPRFSRVLLDWSEVAGLSSPCASPPMIVSRLRLENARLSSLCARPPMSIPDSVPGSMLLSRDTCAIAEGNRDAHRKRHTHQYDHEGRN